MQRSPDFLPCLHFPQCALKQEGAAHFVPSLLSPAIPLTGPKGFQVFGNHPVPTSDRFGGLHPAVQGPIPNLPTELPVELCLCHHCSPDIPSSPEVEFMKISHSSPSLAPPRRFPFPAEAQAPRAPSLPSPQFLFPFSDRSCSARGFSSSVCEHVKPLWKHSISHCLKPFTALSSVTKVAARWLRFRISPPPLLPAGSPITQQNPGPQKPDPKPYLGISLQFYISLQILGTCFSPQSPPNVQILH